METKDVSKMNEKNENLSVFFPRNSRFLTPDEVELRVGNTAKNHKKCTVLIYKTARIDMEMLDYMFGANNWQDDYKEIKGVMYCGIGVRGSIFDSKLTDWVWKWNAGVESKGMDDDNNKKGEASDAFKRAGTLWGIGRELYKWKEIEIALTEDDFWIFDKGSQNEKWKLKTNFSIVKLEYTETGLPKELVISDDNLVERFNYSKQTTTESKEQNQNEEIKKVDKKEDTTEIPVKKYGALKDLCIANEIDFNKVTDRVGKLYNKKINDLNDEEWTYITNQIKGVQNAEVQMQ